MQSTHILWGWCAAAVVMAGVSTWAERRRADRRDPDRVGFMPWSLLLILSIIVAAVLAAVALKSAG